MKRALLGPTRVLGAAFLAILSMGATCSPDEERAENVVATVGSKTQVETKHPDGTWMDWDEVTAAAFGPGEHSDCPKGRLFFAAGQNVVSTDLDGKLDPAPVPGGVSNPVTLKPTTDASVPGPFPIWDNHLVKGRGGVLIHTVEGITWWPQVTPKPAWWDYTQYFDNRGGKAAGGRGTIWVFRSTDCGQSWKEVTSIDSATIPIEGGEAICGYPRFANTAWAASFDSHLMNVDPGTGDLFVTTACLRGLPLEPGVTIPGTPKYDLNSDGTPETYNLSRLDGIVVRSTNNGDSWKVVCYRPNLDGWWGRVPITTFGQRVGLVYATEADKSPPSGGLDLSHPRQLKLITFDKNGAAGRTRRRSTSRCR